MNRVNALLHLPEYEARLSRLTEREKDRPFCRHGLEHLLEVARIMWIFALEEGLSIDREIVYATALLHDLGRLTQLEEGTPHHEAGAALALSLLPQADFTGGEVQKIAGAIRSHRGSVPAEERGTLGALLYRADKQCRPCWCCPARADCNWPEERKNTGIVR